VNSILVFVESLQHFYKQRYPNPAHILFALMFGAKKVVAPLNLSSDNNLEVHYTSKLARANSAARFDK
jgi:hypothetical protein